MPRQLIAAVIGLLTLVSFLGQAKPRPDVLFITVDDLNDWISLLDSKSPIRTPNLERLANRGTLFTRAYCMSAACNPSRAATMLGQRPSSTGIYGNKSNWRWARPKRKTIMQRFREAGYLVKGAGKIFHHHYDGAFHDDASFDEFQHMRPQLYPPQKINQAKQYGSRNTDWGVWPSNIKDSIDHGTTEYCIRALKHPPKNRPLFLACGIFKPHSPFFAPAEFHRKTDIGLPVRKSNDWADLPNGATNLLRSKKWFWSGMMNLDQQRPGSYQAFVNAYAACVRFADTQIGKVLDALDASPRKDNTIVVLWSDHGFHLGEKDHIEKFALWEKANHIPFIVVAPGMKRGVRCDTPVDMSVLYPTLLKLAGLPEAQKCDGQSIVPLLRDPQAKWDRPAVMTYGKGNHAVRSERWRYIRYADGSEELYDHSSDENEWTNLADEPKHANVIAAHKKWLPGSEANAVPNLQRKSPRKKKDSRPNILLIVSEDNGPELGCYGDPYVRTPVLDKLASEGVRFDRAYVPQAGCSQSRAAYFTGLYPHQNGQIGLATWKFRMYRADTPNMVHSLKDAGYRTGIIGKLHVNPKEAFPFDFKEIGTSNFARKKLKNYATQAKRFITASDQPFFLSVNYPDPHRPFTRQTGGLPKEPLDAGNVKPLAYFGVDAPDLREQTANYYNCMSRLDTLIGQLLEELRASGKYDNTLIVYLGDHGADLLRGKRTSYEGGVRVPLIIKWANRWKAENDKLVSTLDLFPTFLEVAKANPVPNLAGRSLIPLLNGEPVKWRSHLFTEYHLHSAHNFYPQRTIRNDRYKLIQNLMPKQVNPGYDFTINRFFEGLSKVIDAAPEPVRGAYERMRQPVEFELYDLRTDPFEFRDLSESSAHRPILNELKDRLMKWRAQTHDPLLNRENLMRLKAEVEACFRDGKPEKRFLELNYPDYFFAQ
tara:strand:+ start:776 stop:3580 length:2805 start_codon:yes stop_codon:yes gene_type:complete